MAESIAIIATTIRISISVNPLEVEEILTRHPQVAEAVVIATGFSDTADRLKAMSDLEGADLFFGHDEQQWKDRGARWYK